jgi:hypothetical protein
LTGYERLITWLIERLHTVVVAVAVVVGGDDTLWFIGTQQDTLLCTVYVDV